MATILAAVVPGDVSFLPVLRTAVDLAGSGSLIVISVFPPPLDWVGDQLRPHDVKTRLDREQREADIAQALRSLGVLGTRIIVPLGRGADPGADIVAQVSELQADLVVVGTRGRKGLARLFLGSVAEHVVRHAPCDVLVVKDRE